MATCPRCGNRLHPRRTKDAREHWGDPVYIVEACVSAECHYWRSGFQVAYPQVHDAVIPNDENLKGFGGRRKR
jgi:hypothetical protein